MSETKHDMEVRAFHQAQEITRLGNLVTHLREREVELGNLVTHLKERQIETAAMPQGPVARLLACLRQFGGYPASECQSWAIRCSAAFATTVVLGLLACDLIHCVRIGLNHEVAVDLALAVVLLGVWYTVDRVSRLEQAKEGNNERGQQS